MKIAKDISQIIGGTPLVELSRLSKKMGLPCALIGKAEGMNPAGSIKDRTALSMLNDAEARGLLRAGGTVIEPTSGNTGIGLAALCAVRGYKLILTMPETMSEERRKLLKALGAELVLTPGAEGMSGATRRAEELHRATPGSIIAGQFVNPANPRAHKSTADEIWRDTDGQVDAVVCSVGTGGTVTGLSKYLREYNKDIAVIAVEPSASPVLSGGKAGPHKIQGIGAGFIPEVLDTNAYDKVITVSNEDAFATADLLAKSEGLLAGISSGAALFAAGEYAKTQERGKKIVVILPDTGDRYLSSGVFS